MTLEIALASKISISFKWFFLHLRDIRELELFFFLTNKLEIDVDLNIHSLSKTKYLHLL